MWGRIPGDDEDSFHITRCATKAAAEGRFERWICGQDSRTRMELEVLREAYGTCVYVNGSIRSKSRMRILT